MHTKKNVFLRMGMILVVVGLIASLTLIPSAAATTTTLKPVADAYVRSDYPTTNYGTGTTLRVDAVPPVISYLRFNVSGLSGITSAKLRVYANSGSTAGIRAESISDNNWGETTLVYNTSFTGVTTFGTSPAVAAGTWISWDVTPFVKGNGMYSFVLTTPNSTAISLGSRESSANSPQLVITAGGSTTPAPTQPAPTQAASSGCTATVLKKGPTLIYTGSNTAMRVFWQWSANATFTVKWGTDTNYASGSANVTASDSTNHLYKYDITGLAPGTRYYYRVQTGSQCASYNFITAPAASATSVKFFSYGDTRTNGSAHNGLAGQINAVYAADPAFQTLNLQVGDWVSGDSESAWTGEYFASGYTALRKQDASLSDIGVRGNHEGSATYWKRYWPEPFQSGGLYWSFDYGPMHVTMLDQFTSYSAGSAQYNWMKADLANTTKKWKIVVLHEPGWTSGGGHGNNTTVQNDLQPLFQQYGVAIVFGGHNHYYARASVSGVTHLTLGSGGAPLYTPASGQPNIVKTYKGYAFGEFTISGTTLTAKIISSSGSTVDTFSITK